MAIDIKILFRLKKHDPALTEIVAKGMGDPISDADIKDLVDAAKSNEFLKKLTLLDGTISSNGAEMIARELPSLESIDLSGNEISDTGLLKLIDMPNLKKLTLIGNNISEGCLSTLNARQNSSLEIIVSNQEFEPLVFRQPERKKSKIGDQLQNINQTWIYMLQEVSPIQQSDERLECLIMIEDQLRTMQEAVNVIKSGNTELKRSSSPKNTAF